MAIEIKVQLIGDKKVAAKMKNLKGFFNSTELRVVLEDAKNRIISLASRLAPRGLTHLLAQISGDVLNFGGSNPKIKVRSAARYARFVEFKTKPHRIEPKDKKSLFWYRYSTAKSSLFVRTDAGATAPVGATFTFANSVNHPGTRAQPFMRPAVQTVQPRLQQAILRVLREKMRA